jgi:hypothetical protein
VITPIIRPSISDEQHDFVAGLSAVTSLVEFSNFVLSEMEDGLQVNDVYTDVLQSFDKVNHGLLLLGTLTRKFRGPRIFWKGYYLTGRTPNDYCHSGVPRGSLLRLLFFIANINDV